ncbi:MAG: hypothetical protein M3Z24_11305 [Chloroflexota bacterium]|nr:hypothetical protein [Chloroflexota bacterium]
MAVPLEPEFEEEDQEAIEQADIQQGDQDTAPSERIPIDTTDNSEPSTENELPPEARGETNGGPLGCCLGVTVGIMISLFVGVIGLGPLLANALTFLIHTSAIDSTRIVTALFALIGAVIFGYLGWKIGKRVYKEYELTPRQQQKLAHLQERELKRLH